MRLSSRKRILYRHRTAKIIARRLAMNSFLEAIGIELMPWQRVFMRSMLRRTMHQKIASSVLIFPRRHGLATTRAAIELAERHLRDVLESHPND